MNTVHSITFLGPAINLSQHQDSQYLCLFGFSVPWVHALVFGNRTKEGRGTCISPLMLFRYDKCYRTCTLYSIKEFHYSWCHNSEGWIADSVFRFSATCVCVCVCDGGYPGGPGPSYSKHAPGPGHISIIVNLLKCKISGTTANL